MRFQKQLIVIFTFVYIITHPVIATELDLSQFTTQKVNEHLYVMSQDYGDSSINFAAVVGDDSVALITTMMKEYSPHVEALIKRITDKPIKYVLSIDGDYYHYYGSKYFVENGATFIAHKNLIPDLFDNRVLVNEPYSLDLGTEKLWVLPTKAHRDDHVMLKLEKSNVIFAGDAISFDWIVYSGPNGPDAQLDALKFMLAQGDANTRYFPGNWANTKFGEQKDLMKLISVYSQFVDKVNALYLSGSTPEEIADRDAIHSVLKPLADYERLSPFLVHFIRDVLGIKGEG